MLIGLCGPEGAGKSTAAKLLVHRYGLVALPMAAPLKSMLATLGIPPQNLYGTPREKAAPLDMLGGHSARHAMQTLGTEWGRDCIDPHLWVSAWAAEALTFNYNCVADDVRFPNECDVIRQAGGKVICVARGLRDFNIRGEHRSASGWQDLEHDAVLYNKTRTLTALGTALDRVLIEIGVIDPPAVVRKRRKATTRTKAAPRKRKAA